MAAMNGESAAVPGPRVLVVDDEPKILAVLRRGLGLDGFRVELAEDGREARRGGSRLDLTAKEFDLLEFFLRHPRHVLTREQIFRGVWGYDFLGSSNVIDVYIRSLREKLEAEGQPRLLHTMRGVGYSLRDEP